MDIISIFNSMSISKLNSMNIESSKKRKIDDPIDIKMIKRRKIDNIKKRENSFDIKSLEIKNYQKIIKFKNKEIIELKKQLKNLNDLNTYYENELIERENKHI